MKEANVNRLQPHERSAKAAIEVPVRNTPARTVIETNSRHGKMQIRDRRTGQFVNKK